MTLSEPITVLNQYSVLIGNAVLHIQNKLSSLGSPKSILIADNNLSYQAIQLSKTLGSFLYLIPSGESSKTRAVKQAIEDIMLEQGFTRDSILIALGGGVIGDLAGFFIQNNALAFVASTFMRGIKYIHVPTSLLAMVDSSIGGKTAVDTRYGKNLIGTFHQPIMVCIDIDYLSTLPARQFSNGMAEVIKTAAFSSESDFCILETQFNQIMLQKDVDLLKRVILGSVKTKAHVVTVDEKEMGLRGLLNFGHTIGHALEAILAPEILHGECVAVGMVKEAEIARHLGYLSDVDVSRLIQCLQSYHLPVSLEDKFFKKYAPNKNWTVDQLMDYMKLDKKNIGSKKRMVLLSTIGQTVEQKPSFVDDDVIRFVLSSSVKIESPEFPLKRAFELHVPGSKSISNRALVLAALGKGTCRIKGLLHSEDVQVMLIALQKLLGTQFEWEDNGIVLKVNGGNGHLTCPHSELYLGNAGTAARFLTSVCTLIPSHVEPVVLTGNPRMKQRPIGPLVDALIANGCQIQHAENQGCLPLKIFPKGLKGGYIQLSANVSSQYVSSLLMAAPYANEPVTIELMGNNVVSEPYIEITLAMMASFGIHVKREGKMIYRVPKGVYTNPSEYLIEGDASSATYPLAFAALTGSKVTVKNIGSSSLQGDARFAVDVLERMGCSVIQTSHMTTVEGPMQLIAIPEIDMEPMTDAFLTLSVLAAVATGQGNSDTTRITGIANQRVKECNRIAAVASELRKFGVCVTELEDGLEIKGKPRDQLTSAHVHCYDDHRVAMSFSLLAMVARGTIIEDKKCTEKTWPSWWDNLRNIFGISMKGADLTLAPVSTIVPKNEKSIVLIGMRGVGKTQTGKHLAHILKRPFIDMDEYLEQKLNTTIPKIIETRGWDKFRELECQYLNEVLSQYPTLHIISCGGGIVESESGIKLLRQWCGRTDENLHFSDSSLRKVHIIHLKRDLSAIVSYLNQDTSRPAFSEDLLSVWNRRNPLYEYCSSSQFLMVDNDWPLVNRSFVQFVKQSLSDEPLKQIKFFLSLTVPNVNNVALSLEDMLAGIDAVELRVDLLEKPLDIQFVEQQYFLLKRLLYQTNATIPIIFTVRTVGQGGKFPDSNVKEYFDLIGRAIRWGAEYVDIEIHPSDSILGALSQPYLDLLPKAKGHTKIIASYHDVSGTAIWHLDSYIYNTWSPTSKMLGETSVIMTNHAQFMSLIGDVVKVIGKANNLSCNMNLQAFVAHFHAQCLRKPLIALNMGSVGQLSRALNTFMTPVTHPLLPHSAAPGQLSVKKIHAFRTLLGLLPPKHFYLYGSPIQQSLSPALHNTGFKSLGLPFDYHLYETSDSTALESVLSREDFGGASVTIPLKEEIIKRGLVQEYTSAVKAIGAVNTIIVKHEQGNRILVGENTDWLGIRGCIQELWGKHQDHSPVGIVLGAGGTSRAAIYALKDLGVKDIRLWNRSFDRAQALANEFGCIAYQKELDLMQGLNSDIIPIVVSTIPSTAQVNWSSIFTSSKGIAIELAYRPLKTPMIQYLDNHCQEWTYTYGYQVLILQGIEQFIRWTQCRAPVKEMKSIITSMMNQ